jgi:ribosome biogenesis GTPase
MRSETIMNIELKEIGFDNWFEEKYKELGQEDFNPARVIEVNKNNFTIKTESAELYTELAGKFLFKSGSSLEMPTVGDWAVVQSFDTDNLAIIHDILPRKSLLKRKDPSKNLAYQLIAANIDFAFIMQSADANFNINRLERYIVTAADSKIQPIILVSKCDLISEAESQQIIEALQRLNEKYQYILFSNTTSAGVDEILHILQPGKTYCLLGSSGVGKTTLLNRLIGAELFDVNAVREKDSKGRHTTSRRQLICLDGGSMIIDTPGMRELGNFGIDSGLEETYDEIFALSKQCRFTDCSHVHEKGCAVIEAVQNGHIDEARYNNFMKIQKESKFYEMSYLEKRQRDKQFSKMVKRVMKEHRKK